MSYLSGRSWPGLAACTLLMVTATLCAEDAAPAKITGDPSLIPQDAKIEELWNEGHFTEGVAAGPDGMIYFSDIALDMSPGRVMKFDPKTKKITVHCADSAKSNGLMFDQKGRLIAACGALYGKRALVEITPDGKLKVLVDKFEGKPLNSPNDLVIDAKGRIYFSDPRYLGPESLDLDHESVFRLDPDGKLSRATTDINKPNGLYLSPDGKTLYAAETDSGTSNAEVGAIPGRMTLNAYKHAEDGTLSDKRVLVDFGDQLGVDGMTVDQQGHIYAAVRSPKRFGIVVYNPDGKELAYLPTPQLPTNCKFGIGGEAKTLYITAGTGFYRVKLPHAGFHPSVGKK